MSKDQAELTLPENLFISDNFFKVRWHGLGNRRLKTCIVILQWIYPRQPVPVFACITLAEAETVRWMMQNSPAFDAFSVSLHALSGEMLAQTSAHAAAAAAAAQLRPAAGGGQAAQQVRLNTRTSPFQIIACPQSCCLACDCPQLQPSLSRIQDAKSAAIWSFPLPRLHIMRVCFAHAAAGSASSTASCSFPTKTLPGWNPYSGTHAARVTPAPRNAQAKCNSNACLSFMHVQDRVSFFESSLRLRFLLHRQHLAATAFSPYVSGGGSVTSGLTPPSSEFCRRARTWSTRAPSQRCSRTCMRRNAAALHAVRSLRHSLILMRV